MIKCFRCDEVVNEKDPGNWNRGELIENDSQSRFAVRMHSRCTVDFLNENRGSQQYTIVFLELDTAQH